MRLARTDDAVRVLCPAKVNLFFEIVARRPDGFHEVETVLAPVQLYDELTFLAVESPEVLLEVAASAAPQLGLVEVPCGERNLAVRAVRRLQERFSVSTGGRMLLTKRIPAAAGLGGGSSNAAGALAAANAAWRLGASPSELAEIAAEIGSDVPFFLGRRSAHCTGRGERCTALPALGALATVIAKPPVGLSAGEVYGRVQPPRSPRSIEPLLAAWSRRDRAGVARAMFNRLEDAAATLTPWVNRLREAFLGTLGNWSQLSGSGTCYFGIAPNRHVAQRAASMLRGRLGCWAQAAMIAA